MSPISEQATGRIRLWVGEAGLARLRGARVLIVGLGAVGSFALEGLARSAVGHLRLVDFDALKPSNLNRQLLALRSSLGRPKVEVARERALAIDPRLEVEAIPAFFSAEEADRLLAPPLDYCVDAIDSLGPKVALLRACVERGLPVVSAMGAAGRADPGSVRVTPLEETRVCPLARDVRKRLARLGIHAGVTAVWSCEAPAAATRAPAAGGAQAEEESLLRGRLRRPLPSMVHLPAIFGLCAANHVVWSILGGPGGGK
ncbi:MAG TPA: tRNA threonylcarbamoyladenosine dehydratase [Myxococcota bacterium]|nr:tRNA threonylcarbamoyladenosine dehydratase [Myxococcota bacterium]HRY94407.1 tRNA threonylcarbamoyladenosine dehydratase [Myxococcota bacterium]